MSKLYRNKLELIQGTIRSTDTVLDVGFWGQATTMEKDDWVHRLLQKQASCVYGVDLDFDESKLTNPANYRKASAEAFSFDVKFDAIFAGDLIEHLSNPGMFLECCRRNLKDDGRLILTTPNAFSLFNIVAKLGHHEPTTNVDHTCYFNSTTMAQLLKKNGFAATQYDYVYLLRRPASMSLKRRCLYALYGLVSGITHRYSETLVVVASRNAS